MAVDIFARIADKTKLVFANRVKQVAQVEIEFQSRKMANDFVREIGPDNYPPEGAGNRPPPPYWQRGTGRVLAGGGVNPPSQNYGTSWQVSGFKTPFGATIRTETPVTYSPFLIDDVKQASWHKKNGWKTISTVAAILGIKINRDGEQQYSVSDGGVYFATAREKIRTALQSVFGR